MQGTDDIVPGGGFVCYNSAGVGPCGTGVTAVLRACVIQPRRDWSDQLMIDRLPWREMAERCGCAIRPPAVIKL